MRYLLAVLLLAASMAVQATKPKWEALETPRTYLEQIDADGFDISVSEGSVYLSLRKPATVKVFTILGQLITQDTLPTGAHRLKMPAKGIYIIKIGSTTRRVTI